MQKVDPLSVALGVGAGIVLTLAWRASAKKSEDVAVLKAEVSSLRSKLQDGATEGKKADSGVALGQVFGGGLGFGDKCALVVVDFCKAYTQEGSKWYCPGPGYGVVDAVRETVPLLALARKKKLPIFYTAVYFEHPSDGGVFTQKIPAIRAWTKDNPLVEFDDNIVPQADEKVVVKQYPSAFFGTALAANLRALKVDTCIVVGCSTSGCIRATVLDGMCHGFRCVVPRECVGDRTESVHESNLFDINAKNGDVMPKADVMAHINKL